MASEIMNHLSPKALFSLVALGVAMGLLLFLPATTSCWMIPEATTTNESQ